ncbi:MAG TPA: DUF1579 domain-containing protein [Allosphingosinicella sp.]|nr:DUF1579 domain-containing protein [Allosphingosinicella sp.]
MFRFAAAAALLLAAAPVSAQDADPGLIAAQRTAMQKLDWMRGRWRGPAVGRGAGGEYRVTQTERIGSFLGGTVMVMEGKGFQADGRTGFNAFGILSFDPHSGDYTLRSYAQGYAGTFKLTPNGTGYVWEIPAGPMTMRYTATLHDGIWTEVGDRIVPGQPPQRFFEMNLKRVGDTNWPEEGAQTP